MQKVRVYITGLKEIDRKLKKLPAKVQGKILRPAMRAGLKVVKSEVESQVPVLTGLTKSAVELRALKKRKRGSISLEVRIGGKTPGLIKQRASGPVFYPAVVEYKKDPFMRRAFQAKGEAARQVTISKIWQGIEKELGK